jgi:hypothetical protein
MMRVAQTPFYSRKPFGVFGSIESTPPELWSFSVAILSIDSTWKTSRRVPMSPGDSLSKSLQHFGYVTPLVAKHPLIIYRTFLWGEEPLTLARSLLDSKKTQFKRAKHLMLRDAPLDILLKILLRELVEVRNVTR